MKHLTKDINQLGRAIAERVLRATPDFQFRDDDEFMSSYFVTCQYKGLPAAIKILSKATTEKFDMTCFQMDEEVILKIDSMHRATNRLIIIVLVDTRNGLVSYQLYNILSAGYTEVSPRFANVHFPKREPSTKDGPVWWNSCCRMIDIGMMSQTERDRLIVLRTKNRADKNQKSIFDK